MKRLNNIWENDKGFIGMLVISIITLISTQLTEHILWEGKLIVRAGFFLFTVIAIHSSSLSKTGKFIGYGFGLVILVLALIMIPMETQGLSLIYTILVSGYMIYIIALVFNQIFSGGPITAYKIGGGVAVYVLIGHIWTTLYLAIFIIHTDAFQYGGEPIRSDEALKQLSYFSFVSLTTIGYGDITALNPVARILVMIEGLLGQLFPAIFIAKLVSRQLEDSRKK